MTGPDDRPHDRPHDPNPAPAIRVRRAETHDLAALTRLRRAWAERRGHLPQGADPAFEQAFAAWWATEQPHRAFWLAEDGADAVGSLNVAEVVGMPAPGHRSERWGYVGNVVVLDGYAARGVPRLLVGAAITHAREQGFARLVLRPSASGAAFYRAAGFAPAGDDMVVLETGGG